MRFLVASPPAQDLLRRANYLFVSAMMASAPFWGGRRSTLRFDESQFGRIAAPRPTTAEFDSRSPRDGGTSCRTMFGSNQQIFGEE
jgi:hypothetical protein